MDQWGYGGDTPGPDNGYAARCPLSRHLIQTRIGLIRRSSVETLPYKPRRCLWSVWDRYCETSLHQGPKGYETIPSRPIIGGVPKPEQPLHAGMTRTGKSVCMAHPSTANQWKTLPCPAPEAYSA